MNPFFQTQCTKLIDPPNGNLWWHNMPLPDGSRINAQPVDKDLQFKMWQAMQIPNEGGLSGKQVLDIGANDGFFTLAAIMAGAKEVTALNSADWQTWPQNIEYASEAWGIRPNLVTADFRTYNFQGPYDVIFFLGVLYHLEDIFTCMKMLRRLLKDGGANYLATQMSKVDSDLPVFEYASDIYSTVAIQDKSNLKGVGISNYFFPNTHAMHNLAYSYNFECESLSGPRVKYLQENPTRGLFKLVKRNALDP